MTDLDELDAALASEPIAPPTLAGATGKRARRPPDPAIAYRNRNNRKRGRSTSHDLAAFLEWQNVEGLNWPWDVQGPAGRIQSKREARGRSAASVVGLLNAIPAGDYLRGAYIVAPRQRLSTGSVTLFLRDWVDWHGWTMPPYALPSVTALGVLLVTMPLAVFRDVHCSPKGTDAPDDVT